MVSAALVTAIITNEQPSRIAGYEVREREGGRERES